MHKLKRIICVLISLFMLFTLSACDKVAPDNNITDNSVMSQPESDKSEKNTEFIIFEKEYFSDYEWYEDTSIMLVRSEYSDVTPDSATSEKYPLLAKTLAETSAMRKKAMEEEKYNLISVAADEIVRDGEAFLTRVSTLDVKVRRADNVVVSIIEDYATESTRSIKGYNYDTRTGKLLTLADIITDTSKIPLIVEKEIISRIGQDEPLGETAVNEYFKNTEEEDLSWTLDYNGITFWFNPGEIAPTNFGIQVITVTYAQYGELFNKKYTVVPDSYIVSLPASVPFFTDITGDNKTEELNVLGYYDIDANPYHTISINSESSEYKTYWFSSVEPYYVRTSDGKNYICVFNLTKEEEGMNSTLSVYEIKNGKTELISTSESGMEYKSNNIFILPSDPDSMVKN